MFIKGSIALIASFFKSYPKFWIIFLTFFLFVGVVIYLTWLVEPKSQLKNILISNITDRQATISWTTEVPTRGALMVSENSSFPILPAFAKDLKKDDWDKDTQKVGYYNTHHITIGGLSPSKLYNFRIFQGQKKVFEGDFKTGATLSTIGRPNPVYGKIVGEDRKPIVKSLIYLQAVNEASVSALLSTVTNSEGGWSVDLANLRDINYENRFTLTKNTTEQLIIETGSLGRVKAATASGKDKPWPTVVIKGK